MHAMSAGAYTEANVKMAGMHEDFVMGFISMTPAKWDWGPGSPGQSSSSDCTARLSATTSVTQVLVHRHLLSPRPALDSSHVDCQHECIARLQCYQALELLVLQGQPAHVLQQCEQSRHGRVCKIILHTLEEQGTWHLSIALTKATAC